MIAQPVRMASAAPGLTPNAASDHNEIGGLDMAARKRTLEERFWSKVQKGAPEDCWEWTGVRTPKGYGRIKVNGRWRPAHRISVEITGRPPKRLWVLHRCDNPPCVNPAHLFLGTVVDNNADMARKGRAREARGESNSLARLTRSDVLEIRRLYATDPSRRHELAERYGVTASHITNVAVGRAWSHV